MSDLAHAGKVRDALRGVSAPGLTVPQIVEKTQLSERLVRIGIGILDALNELHEDRLHVPKKRGAMPAVFQLINPSK